MTRPKTASKSKPPASPRASRLLVYGLAFTVFALPVFILPNATEYGYTKTILAIVLVSILCVLWGIEGWRRGTWAVRLPWLTWPFLALVAASLFSLLRATNGRFVVQSLVLFVYFFLLLVLIANAVREKRDVALLLGSFLASVSLVSLYGILQYIGAARGPGEGAGLHQVISTLGNKEYVAGLLVYSLFPAVILLFRLRSRVARAGALSLLAFNFGSLLLFDQTGANLSLLVAAVALAVGWLIFRPLAPLRRTRGWILALIIACGVAFLVEAPSGPLNSVVGLSADETSWIESVWKANSGAVRSWDWWIGVEMWRSSPWVGVGLGNYKLGFLPYKAAFLETPRGASYDFYIARAAQAHNEYVQVLAEIGLIGMLALTGLLVVLIVSLLLRLAAHRDEDDRVDLLLLAAGLAAVAVHALVSFPAHLPASSLAAVLACGLAFAPTYGDRATISISLRGWKLRAAVVVVALVGTLVSVVAVRDLASNIILKRGIDQVQLGQTEAAVATLERSLRLDFAPHQTYFYLGMAQARLGRLEAAFESFRLCQTRFVDENGYLAYAELAANLGKMDVAEEAVGLLIASQPSEPVQQRARYVQSVIAIRANDLARANALLTSLVADAPDFEMARIALAGVLAAQGLTDEAIAEYRVSLKLVEKKLAQAEKKAAAGTRMPATEYGELRSLIASLRSERTLVNDRLKALGGL